MALCYDLYMKMSIRKAPSGSTSSYSIAGLRAELSRAVREAEAGRAVEVTRRGETVAVLLGLPEYERLRRDGGGFSENYDRFREETPLGELAITPEEVFGGLRDRDPGREVVL